MMFKIIQKRILFQNTLEKYGYDCGTTLTLHQKNISNWLVLFRRLTIIYHTQRYYMDAKFVKIVNNIVSWQTMKTGETW
jgi:hypothetical protein